MGWGGGGVGLCFCLCDVGGGPPPPRMGGGLGEGDVFDGFCCVRFFHPQFIFEELISMGVKGLGALHWCLLLLWVALIDFN